NGFFDATNAFIVMRPGAVLDASGAHAALGLLSGRSRTPGNLTASIETADVASNGGSITINSYNGLYLDGSIRAAAGGPGAAGGALTLVLESPDYSSTHVGLIPDDIFHSRILTVTQDAVRTGLPSDLVPGDVAPLIGGYAHISQEEVSAGGFDNL